MDVMHVEAAATAYSVSLSGWDDKDVAALSLDHGITYDVVSLTSAYYAYLVKLLDVKARFVSPLDKCRGALKRLREYIIHGIYVSWGIRDSAYVDIHLPFLLVTDFTKKLVCFYIDFSTFV